MNLPVAKVRLVADSITISFLGRFYDFAGVTTVPPMRRGVNRYVRDDLCALPPNASVIIGIPWDPSETSLAQYSLNLKSLLFHLDRQDLKVTIIWPVYASWSKAEKTYFRAHLRKFRRWLRLKRLLIDVIPPAQPIPTVTVSEFVGNPEIIFGPRFFHAFNYILPKVEKQTLPTGPYIPRPVPTIPLDQSFNEFISNKRA